MHGYRLKEIFDQRVSPLWGLTTSQTESGKREFATWLRQPPQVSARPFREDLLLRLMVMREGDAPMLAAALEHQEYETRSLLMRVTHLCSEQRRLEGKVDLPRVFLEGMARHLAADRENLQTLRGEIERWLHQHASSAR